MVTLSAVALLADALMPLWLTARTVALSGDPLIFSYSKFSDHDRKAHVATA